MVQLLINYANLSSMFQVFKSNYDYDTIVEQRLTRTAVARFVCLNVKKWITCASMRIEFQGEYIGKTLTFFH